MSATILKATAAAIDGCDTTDAKVKPIKSGGSDRKYYRIQLSDGSSIVYMQYTLERPDNISFAPATKTLTRLRAPVPKMLAHDDKKHRIWLQDLGDEHLFDHRDSPWPKRRKFYKAVLDKMAKIHQTGAGDLKEDELDHLEPAFDEDVFKWERDYFFEHFLNHHSRRAPTYVRSLPKELEFSDLATSLSEQPRSLIHRDLQSQNVLIKSGRPYLIDYQGLRLGLPEYDIASLLYDPYVDFDDDERDELIAHAFKGRDEDEWKPRFYGCAAQRLMQTLGAYCHIGHDLDRPEYLEYVTPALDNLREVLEIGAILPRLAPYLSPEALQL